jgi:2,5-furandicarboxylate decarboxylase 1
VVVTEAQGSRLDPSSRNGVSAKMGFDATVPIDSPPLKFKRIRVPGEETVDLGQVIEDGADWRKAVG